MHSGNTHNQVQHNQGYAGVNQQYGQQNPNQMRGQAYGQQQAPQQSVPNNSSGHFQPESRRLQDPYAPQYHHHHPQQPQPQVQQPSHHAQQSAHQGKSAPNLPSFAPQMQGTAQSSIAAEILNQQSQQQQQLAYQQQQQRQNSHFEEQQYLHQLSNHMRAIDKLSQRIYDGLYQLIKIKFGFAEINSEALSNKFNSLVKEKLYEMQMKSANYIQQQQQKRQQAVGGQAGNNNTSAGQGFGGDGTHDMQGTQTKEFDRVRRTDLVQNIFPHQDCGPEYNREFVETTKLSEQEQLHLQETVEIKMVENDRNLENGLVQALLQIDAHKQNLLQIVSRMREQSVANERRQKKFVDLLMQHQSPAESQKAENQQHMGHNDLNGDRQRASDEKEPLDMGMLFAPIPPQQTTPLHSQARMVADRGSFFLPNPQRSWGGGPPTRGQNDHQAGRNMNQGGQHPSHHPQHHPQHHLQHQPTEDWFNFDCK